MGISLTAQEYNDLLTAERNLSSMITEFDKFERCGNKCDQLRTMTQQQLAYIQKLKSEYAPQITE